HTSPERVEWQPQIVTTYKWVGGRFVRSGIWQDAPPQTPWEWLDAGRRQFAAGDYREARSALRRAANWKPSGRARDPSFDGEGGRQQAYYCLALCEALLGERTEAVQAMRQAEQRVGEGQTAIPSLARKFLDAGGRQGDLPRALAAVGQVFRTL